MNVRKATAGDLLLYYNWANEPDVRANSIHSESISLPDHTAWFNKKLTDSNTIFLLFEINDQAVGQLRIDLDNQSNLAIINFSIDKEQRNKGYGTKILQAAYSYFKTLNLPFTFTGYVKPSNIGSLKAFEHAGYAINEQHKQINGEDYVVFTKP